MTTDNAEVLDLSWWQADMVQDVESDQIVVTAGYGSGKTYGAALFAYDRILMNPGTDVLFIEPKFEMIRSVAIPAFELLFSKLGLVEGVHFRIFVSTQSMKIKFCTGDKIHFLSGQEPKRIAGYTQASCAVIDEAALQDVEVLRKTVARCRNKAAKKCQVLLTTTTEGINWCAELFDSDTLPGWKKINKFTHTIKRKVIVRGEAKEILVKRIRATTFSNEHNLDSNYIANLFANYGHNENYIAAYIYGYFRPFATGLAIPSYISGFHDVENIEADPHRALNLSFDFNAQPLAWVAFSQMFIKNDGLKYVVHDCARSGYGLIEDACIEFAARFPVEKYRDTEIRILGDRTGFAKSHKHQLDDFSRIQKVLKSLGYKNVTIRARKEVLLEADTLETVNRLFRNQYLYICEVCQPLKRSFAMTTLIPGQRKIAKPSGDDWTHFVDALKYGLHIIAGDFDGKQQKKILGFNH